MAKIIYGYKGKTSFTAKVFVGKDKTPQYLEFRGGKALAMGKVLDTKFSTSNEAIQKAIESSKDFKDKKIYKVKAEGKAKKDPDALTGVPEVTSLPLATEYLVSKYEAKSEEVSTKVKIVDFAASKGIAFPNLK